MGHCYRYLSIDATIMVSKNSPITGEHVGIIFVTLSVAIATPLNFRKVKVAVNPMYRFFLNFAKSWILSCLPKLSNKKKVHRAVFEI